MRDFVAAAVQVEIDHLDPAANTERLVKSIHDAEADLVVLPELANIGYPAGTDSAEMASYYDAAEPLGGPFTTAMLDAAGSAGCHVVAGFAERHADIPGVLANSVALFAPGRSPVVRRKAHLPRIEKMYFQPGADLTPVDTELGRLGMLVCADNSFPEAARVLALRGAEVLTVSYQAPRLANPVLYHGLVATRAYENQCFVVAAQRCGRQQELTFSGTSAIGAPDGALVAALDEGPGVARATLDPRLLLETRLWQTRFRDRRPDLYTPITEP